MVETEKLYTQDISVVQPQQTLTSFLPGLLPNYKQCFGHWLSLSLILYCRMNMNDRAEENQLT